MDTKKDLSSLPANPAEASDGRAPELGVVPGSGFSRSRYTPPIGSQVRFSTCGTIATVTGHTARGFTYKNGPVLSIPRLGIQGTGEGECYTDVPNWDSYVIRFKPEGTASYPNSVVIGAETSGPDTQRGVRPRSL